MKLVLLSLFIFVTFSVYQPHYYRVNGLLYHGDKPFGGERTFYNGSTKKVGNYLEGKLHGKFQYFFSSGQLKKDMYYEHGIPLGTHQEFYENGTKKKLVELKEGKHHGDYIEWYKSGQIYAYAKYVNGKEIGYKKWRPNGRIYTNVVIKEGRNIGLPGGKLCLTSKDSQ